MTLKGISPLRLIFLALTVWGAIHPMAHYAIFIWQSGEGFAGMIDAWFANHSTTGLAWDLLITSIAAAVWILTESVQRRTWRNLLAIPAIFLIGLAFGLPLYLFLRSRPSS